MFVILTGERNAGKTTAVERTVAALRDRGREVVGFFTVETPGGLALVDARTGTSRPFATIAPAREETVPIGRFHVDPAAIDHGLELADRDGDVLVVDEIGRLERDRRGFYPIIAGSAPGRFQGVLFSVRRGVVGFVERQLPAGSTAIVEVTPSNREELPGALASMLFGDEDGADA